jgi:hypothetical protein
VIYVKLGSNYEVVPSMRLRTVLIGLVVVAVLGACSLADGVDQGTSTPGTNPHVAALEQLPAFQLVYPGAVLLKQGAVPPSKSIDGNEGAVAAKVYGIPAPLPVGVDFHAVLGWYHRQLQAQGWRFVPATNVSTYIAREYWAFAQYYANVGVYDNALIKYYQPTIDINKYPLVFDVSVGESGYQGS